MASSTYITIDTVKSRANLDKLVIDSTTPKPFIQALINFLVGLASGAEQGTLSVYVGGTAAVAASATATFSTIVATNKVTINAVDFECVNSGATGNQFNKGADDTAAAVNCAAAINASTTTRVAGYVVATSALGVVTITALQKGIVGNSITLAKTGAPVTVTGSGFLASGAGDNVARVTYSVAP